MVLNPSKPKKKGKSTKAKKATKHAPKKAASKNRKAKKNRATRYVKNPGRRHARGAAAGSLASPLPLPKLGKLDMGFAIVTGVGVVGHGIATNFIADKVPVAQLKSGAGKFGLGLGLADHTGRRAGLPPADVGPSATAPRAPERRLLGVGGGPGLALGAALERALGGDDAGLGRVLLSRPVGQFPDRLTRASAPRPGPRAGPVLPAPVARADHAARLLGQPARARRTQARDGLSGARG
jgi:hypothetical protein